MAKKDIAVDGATVSADNGVSASIASAPSTKVQAGGAGVYRGTITVDLSGGSLGTCVGSAGTGTISPTSTKALADGQAPIRKGDTGSGSVNGTDSATALPCSIPVSLEIDSAGQAKVSSE